MAKTANKGFFMREGLNGLEHVGVQEYILKASSTFTIGDLVRVNTSGHLVTCATGEAPAGVLVGIVSNSGISAFESSRVESAAISGATITGDDTVATASDNVTNTAKNLKGQVLVDVSGQLLFYNDSDSTLALTNLFQFFDVDSGDQVTVGSASDANGQVQLMALDPDGDGDVSKGLFRIAENQFGIGLDTATAKNAA